MKLPRWEPRARRGIFVRYSSVHSSDMPLVLNIHAGHISPQYYVVFYDSFSTVPSLALEEEPPSYWSAIDFSTDLHRDFVSQIPFDKDSTIRYDAEYMTLTELEERARLDTHDARIRSTYNETSLGNPVDSTKTSFPHLAVDPDFPSLSVSNPINSFPPSPSPTLP